MTISNENDKKFYIANLAEIIPKKDIIIKDIKDIKQNKLNKIDKDKKEKSFTDNWENFIKFESCWSM